ncbi:CDGSH iron-sulfur domain-containing protein [Candidatus Pacearchaeota archaeon]|nr:CDGSH iron-sulfur domain-containing protein [Candidatus Pacearchaeota archaeon]
MENTEKKLTLKKEIKYSFCTCGASQNLPFCDESHKKLNEETNCNYKSLKITPEGEITIIVSSKNWEKNS